MIDALRSASCPTEEPNHNPSGLTKSLVEFLSLELLRCAENRVHCRNVPISMPNPRSASCGIVDEAQRRTRAVLEARLRRHLVSWLDRSQGPDHLVGECVSLLVSYRHLAC